MENKKHIINIDRAICSPLAEAALNEAEKRALDNKWEFLTPEMVLAAIVRQKCFVEFGKKTFIESEMMSEELEEYLSVMETIKTGTPQLSQAMKRVVKDINRLRNAEDYVSVIDLVVSIKKQKDTFASEVMRNYMGEYDDIWLPDLEAYYQDDEMAGCDRMDEFQHKSNVKAKAMKVTMFNDPESGERVTVDGPIELTEEELMENLMAHAGKLFSSLHDLNGGNVDISMNVNRSQKGGGRQQKEPWEMMVTNVSETYAKHNRLVGREEELDLTIQVLCQKDKNNPLHVGEAGVGKTALVYGLARRIAEGDVPEMLQGSTIYMLDLGSLVAGSSYHGEYERRVKELMDGMQRRGKCICYIDEIHNIMNANGGGQNSMDTSNLLKSYLEDGSIRFIGSTTYQEYNRYMAKNKGIVRRFQQIDIQEPSIEQSIEILEGIVPEYEKFHKVRYDREAVVFAVEQSARLMSDRFLPDKAISIIDRAGAYRQTHPLLNKNGQRMSEGRQHVDKKLVGEIMAKVCKINAKALAQEDNAALQHLSDHIADEIYGQQAAIDQVVRAVKMSKAGLTLGDKPLASLLFVGPTGVGKTEVCKVLARELGVELVRFDMSEYTEKHTVAKLIGSPAGYVGYDDGGLLTDAIRKSPNCVLLLDEIEKAHSDIYNILLQVMDYANLTDNRGNKVDFKNVILIMTSNAGAQYADQASIGFGGGTSKGSAMLQTVKKVFKPEFLNRLSQIVVFNDMDETMASLILDKKLRQLSQLLDKKQVTLTLADDARQLLLKHGFSHQYGAREMDRAIQELLTPLLMDEILFGKLKKGGNATAKVVGEKLQLVINK